MAIKGDARVARRYATALFDAVEKSGDGGIEAAAADLSVIEEMLRNVQYLRAVILQPLVSDENKLNVVAEAFQSRLGPLTFGFINLLIRKRRENLIDETIAEFRRLADERAGRLEALVESSIALTPDQEERLRQAIEARTGKTVRLSCSVDPAMLGGLRVRLGDDIIDGSLNTRLERVRQLLTAAR